MVGSSSCVAKNLFCSCGVMAIGVALGWDGGGGEGIVCGDASGALGNGTGHGCNDGDDGMVVGLVRGAEMYSPKVTFVTGGDHGLVSGKEMRDPPNCVKTTGTCERWPGKEVQSTMKMKKEVVWCMKTDQWHRSRVSM